MGHIRRGRFRHPGILDRDQRQRRPAHQLQGGHQRGQLHDRHLPDRLVPGLGARKIADVTPSAFRQTQPPCLTDVTTELYDCGTWAVSATWQVPASAVSGVYFALLTRPDNGDQSHITFMVRSDGSHSDVVFQTSDTSWQAYNTTAARISMRAAQNGRAYKLSYNRPGQHPRRHGRPRLLLQQRVPPGPLPGEERLRRQLHQRRGHRPERGPAPQPQGLPLRGPRRILVRRAAGQRGGRPRCRA